MMTSGSTNSPFMRSPFDLHAQQAEFCLQYHRSPYRTHVQGALLSSVEIDNHNEQYAVCLPLPNLNTLLFTRSGKPSISAKATAVYHPTRVVGDIRAKERTIPPVQGRDRPPECAVVPASHYSSLSSTRRLQDRHSRIPDEWGHERQRSARWQHC